MSFLEILIIDKPKLNNAILIEGLPGIGNVGKLAVSHLINVLNAKKSLEIYSSSLPPQVKINKGGIVSLTNNEFYYYKNSSNQRDVIFLTGEHQGLDHEGQYDLCIKIIELAKEMGVTEIITLGGYGLGKIVDNPRVLGAATSTSMVNKLKKVGVQFSEDQEDSNAGIVGASGLLLGLGSLEGLEGGCLMGETSGYIADPKSAREILLILQKLLSIEIDLSELDDKVEKVGAITKHLSGLSNPLEESEVDINYIE